MEALPDLGTDLRRHVANRRLQLQVTVDAEGRARDVAILRSELPPEVQRVLEQAIGRVRFAPRTEDDAVMRTRLCFDDAGVLDPSADECWRPGR